ncbi:MAG: hypothetical protein P9L99_14005 [Candidatus Lernaella stagnicola]|nr:hypothetical protein [Candidatus Lernaella stagnicola]
MRRAAYFLATLILFASASLLLAEGSEGELRVFLILSQRSGPDMLNKVIADIGPTQPVQEVWGRKQTLIKKVAADHYVLAVRNVEACHFDKCVPCPDQSRDIHVLANQRTDVIFRFKAKYDRAEHKWVCY